MDLGISGKVAMVAASTKGIGFAIARQLAMEGCKVSICARHEESLEAAASAIGDDTRSYVVDVSNSEDLTWWVEQTVQDLGGVDILVTNTGGPAAGTIDQITDEQWQAGFDSTLMNVVRLVGGVQPIMAERGWGRIVHITSLVAKEPSRVLPISSTLRAGIMALTRIQATEFAAQGITVNSVLPGHTLTDRQHHLSEVRAQREGISPAEALARQAEEIPMKRMATPDEIGAAVAFLCCEQAAYITGVNLLVDGGLTKGLA
ncbi:MAG: SDR family oxidoreductase [Fimbriimonas sp.]|nr:SDR family oxidoreductase [Fimbriimonas sp.]